MEQLTHEDGLRITELAVGATMTVQSMGELVDDLETSGYVERRADAHDRRAKRVFFTARGREVVSASDTVVRDLERSLENLVGSRGYRQLRSMVLAIIERDSPAESTDSQSLHGPEDGDDDDLLEMAVSGSCRARRKPASAIIRSEIAGAEEIGPSPSRIV